MRVQRWRLYGTIGLSTVWLILNHAFAWACLPKPAKYDRINDFSVLAKLPKLYQVNLRENPIDTSTCSGRWADACEPDSTGR